MKKVWLVFKNEFISVVGRRSFLLTLFLLPLVSFLILLIVTGIQRSSGTDASTMLGELFMPSAKSTMEGFVDQSGLVKSIPEGYRNRLQEFSSEKEMQEALAESKISAYYLIEPDYLENGTIICVRPDFNPLGGSIQSSSIDALMAYNLADQNIDIYYRLQNPIVLTTKTIDATAPERDNTDPMTYVLPYIVAYLFYIVIFTSASLLLSSITKEKQNRIMEVLMTSLNPQQILTGKIVALGLVGLLQTVIWAGSGLLLLRFSGRNLALGDAFQLPAGILIWGILFFVFGYAVFASLMAGVGALVPSMREASQLTMVIVMPLIVPLMFISSMIQSPNSYLSIILSLFPFTSPVAMMTRLSATEVPFWQCALALTLLALCAIYLVRASANLFRSQNLLSGKSISVLSFFKALVGKTIK